MSRQKHICFIFYLIEELFVEKDTQKKKDASWKGQKKKREVPA